MCWYRRRTMIWKRVEKCSMDNFQAYSRSNLFIFVDCPQCYCGEIRQTITFLINVDWPKVCHRPDHSIRIVENHGKQIINTGMPKPNIFTGTRTQERFRVCGFCSCNVPAETRSWHRPSVLLGRA
jgi:hypothetical protein